MKQTPTSPYAPDLEELRSWLEKRVAAMKLVELVAAVIALIARMHAINLELTKRVAHLTRKVRVLKHSSGSSASSCSR